MEVLSSQLDASVNFVEQQLTGFIESRYVRRQDDYFIAYLSSQTGCNRGCKMCHLTATKQTQFVNCDLMDFVSQFETVLTHYDQARTAKTVHLNFMSRGEALANPTVTDTSTDLFLRLGRIAQDRGLAVKFNLSTIMPLSFRKTLVEAFPIITPTIYYSLYSVKDSFRNKWLPAAMPASRALDLLEEYQAISKKIIKFHGAFIAGENDSFEDIDLMMRRIKDRNIVGEFNIVRYNPFSAQQGRESDRIEEIASQIGQTMPCKIIPRVGSDVSASCGQFIQKENAC